MNVSEKQLTFNLCSDQVTIFFPAFRLKVNVEETHHLETKRLFHYDSLIKLLG